VPLDSLCPDAAFAEHNTTTSSGKPSNQAFTLKTRTSDDGRGDDAGLE
jgi:hypothetical protein